MKRYYYSYTRPQKYTHNYPDPDHKLFLDQGVEIIETPFGNDNTYLCYCESDEAKINWVLNSQSEFDRKKFKDIEDCTERCNNNLEYEEGEEFTNDWEGIVDNRILDLDII